ncbi:putative glutamine amidotransferase [Nitratiruptor sp. YY08-26]|uniref:gamma-glutamyl-gamma-aminobutyrate hydrolase family protein n=1 Tax=unclassified Nitratiruptor TaxID=2624044 RepID=UPI0019167D92|nr:MULTISPECIES: gamma-glutamyl-gamma-aminobutyrate hydrolase family protein [unclassified Nitratiruptor]BCD62697.1 putative glutamine amidotransferase [Nitratiruptor sp. YY08-13]BCD66633.1 putative glutamine amidotransferase [Nitratiruptor sp. YY08-26]
MAQEKRIVVTGSKYKSLRSWFFIRFLLKLSRAKPLFVHPDTIPPKDFDALLISGGIDICPSAYGMNLELACDKKRDALEFALFEKALQKALPVFGICRGMQLINVALGGDLHPHIENLDLTFHHPYTPLPLQTIEILPHTKLHKVVQASTIKANALHHQAVNRLGKGLRVAAKDKNGIIQAIEHIELPIFGVQWHPEYLPYIQPHRKLFTYFAKGSNL